MLFSSPVLFELPVLPRVKKYLRHKLTDASGQAHPLLASPQVTGPGMMLWAMAQSEKRWLFSGNVYRQAAKQAQRPPCKLIRFDQKLTDQIGVGISEYHYTRHQYLLNYIELEVFSNFIDYLIHNEVVQFCQAAPATAPMVRIKAFCDQYDFSPDDISEEALKQMYLRHRKGKAASTYNAQVLTQLTFVPHVIAA